MPKIRSFELAPLAPEVLASLESLGQKIAATRKARSITQREMATSIGISPQTMLFIEQGRPNVQIGHYARALSALDGQMLSLQTPPSSGVYKQSSSSASKRANAMQRYLATAQQQTAPYTAKLQFAYDWANSNMADETLIRKVVDKGRFHDLAVICKRYGLDRVRKIASDKIALSPSLRRSFNNIEQGFAHEQLHSA